MNRAAAFALLVAACSGESERRELAPPAPHPLACEVPYSFPGKCLDLCFPYDGRCSSDGLCSCPRVECDPCADTCPEGTRCAMPATDTERGCFAPEDSAEPVECVELCDICDPNACAPGACVRFEQDAGPFDCRARSRPGASCQR